MAKSGSNGSQIQTDKSSEFVSPSHMRSIQLTEEARSASEAGNREAAENLQRTAQSIAKSMGESGRYQENPFKEKENEALHEQFKQAANMKMQREMEITAKEADIGHGM